VIELSGQIERITYTNEENGYTVARVAIEGSGETATVVGFLHEPAPGTTLRMRGEWTVHPKFGQQFKLEEYETVTPKTASTIERYLSAGAVKGIGPATARLIVRKFGADSLEVMDRDIGRLREISGIGRKRLAQIKQSWESQKAVREVMLFLQGNGVSPAYAAKVYRRYGAASVAVVKKNPYRLANDIQGIGFATADHIAGALGYPRDGEQRAEAGLLYTLERCVDEGHVFLPADELVIRGVELLEIDENVLRGVLSNLEKRGRIVIDRSSPGRVEERVPKPPTEGGTPIYPLRLYECEVRVAQRLRSLSVEPLQQQLDQPAGALLSGRLGDEQQRAVKAAFEHGVTVITGGPGTGKTTVIDALVRGFSLGGLGVLLAAPTGRAAKRMTEATGREAKTIHRLLEVGPGGGFKRTRENPLDADVLIVDEISMVDVLLMAALLDALPARARLVMVGDADQLPSVGPGNILADVIAAGSIPVARLTQVYRQEQDSRIVSGAYDIIHGRLPQFSADEEGDFYFIEQSEPDRVVGLIATLVRERIPARFGLDPVEEVQVLTPMNRGATGTSHLNETLQQVLNPSTAVLEQGARSFRPGDKVMQTRNNYDLDVFNGDIGRVTRVDSEASELVVSFDTGEVAYGAESLEELTLAYAITVHKSQGSEFPAVVLPLLTQHYMLLQRNLLYTAVTRGKRLVVIVGSRKALSMAIGNDRTQERNTALAPRLR